MSIGSFVASRCLIATRTLQRKVHRPYSRDTLEQSFRVLFMANRQPMWIYELSTLRFLEVNTAACRHYGYSRSEFLRLTVTDIRSADERSEDRSDGAFREALGQDGGVRRHLAADARVIEVEVGSQEIVFDGRDAVLATIRDVTARNALERERERERVQVALHDPSTGLPNRALFLDRLDQSLKTIERTGGAVGVLYVELDGFQLIDESLGYDASNAVLAELGSRLIAALPPGSTVANIAGEQLALCAAGLVDVECAMALARQVQAIVAEPLVAPGGPEISLSACIGVTTATSLDVEASALLRAAARAAAQAKEIGPGHIAGLNEAARPVSLGRLTARHALLQAIESGQIDVHYQPVVSLVDGGVVGVEALARWSHPERGLISPAEFIPLAEETGLIIPLGRIVLEQACRQAAEWARTRQGTQPFTLSVNVSGHQLRSGQLHDLVRAALADGALGPVQLALEITETVLIDHGEAVVNELTTLRELGVQLSLDDFGTGYSSLTHLDRLPFDIVKIDRSFVTGMHDDARHQAIVAGVITLAHTLGLIVVAEGVESAIEAEDLGRLGATLAQGYHFYHPMTAANVAALLSPPG